MKKFIKFSLVLIILFTLTACGKETDAIKFKKEYESLNNKKVENSDKRYRKVKLRKDNSFIYAKAKDINDMIKDKKTFIVYFGFPTCPWCRSVISELDNVSKDLNYNTIYYVNVLDIRDKYSLDNKNKLVLEESGTSEYKELIQLLDDVLDDYVITTKEGKEYNVGEKRIYAPNVVAVVDGKAKQLETGISKKQEDAYQELTDKMKKETYNKFKCLINCLLKEQNTCESKTSC